MGSRIDGTIYSLFQSDLGFRRQPVQILGSCNHSTIGAPGGPLSGNTSRSEPISVRLARQAR